MAAGAPVKAEATATHTGTVLADLDDGIPELHQVFSAGQRANNRRQSYRLKDEIGLSWKLITTTEFYQVRQEFIENQFLPLRDKVARFKQMLHKLDGQLARLAEVSPKTELSAAMMRQQLEVLFFRANTQEEEDRLYRLVGRFLVVVDTLVNTPTFPAKANQLVYHLRWQLEMQQQRDWMDYRTDPKLRRDMPMVFKRLQQDIAKMLEELRMTAPELADLMRHLLQEMQALNLKRYDRPGEGDLSQALLTTHAVNISDTGIGFHTRNWEAPKLGYLVELSFNLVTDEGPYASFRGYGQVVVVKAPGPDGTAMIGCHYILMQKDHHDLLYQYLAIRQRERLSQRIK